MLGLAVQALACRFLPGRPATVALVRALRGAVRHRGDQQQLLPAAPARDVCQMARTGAAAVPVCRQSKPLPDTHEEAEGPRRSVVPLLRGRQAAWSASRSGPLSAPPWLEGRPATAGDLPTRTAEGLPSHDRVPRHELV